MTETGEAAGKGGKKTRGADEPIVIKKYANRRLYNTATSSYVTLDYLADMVKNGQDFVVYDAKTNDDLTRQILTQIIFEHESRGQALLPGQFLRQLIGIAGQGQFRDAAEFQLQRQTGLHALHMIEQVAQRRGCVDRQDQGGAGGAWRGRVGAGLDRRLDQRTAAP